MNIEMAFQKLNIPARIISWRLKHSLLKNILNDKSLICSIFYKNEILIKLTNFIILDLSDSGNKNFHFRR